MILRYDVLPNEEGEKISNILKSKLNISSRLLTKLKMNEKILVDDKPVFSSYLVHSGDSIEVKIDFEEEDAIIPEKMNLDILYEDEYLLAVNKPSGMVVHPSPYHPNQTLANGVKFHLNNKKKIRPINRLDKDTSGIVIFAKNEYVQETLIKQMNNKTFKKEYLAVVCGKLSLKKGTINKPIARKENSIIERCISNNGKQAITQFEVLKEYDTFSLIKCVLETGRTHQIRVHLASINHPLLGDDLYGSKSDLIDGQALACYKLSFYHPISKNYVSFKLNDCPFEFL